VDKLGQVQHLGAFSIKIGRYYPARQANFSIAAEQLDTMDSCSDEYFIENAPRMRIIEAMMN
jgi:hypothetical protein